jgi:nucleoside-diphosphate-sugar epimerase
MPTTEPNSHAMDSAVITGSTGLVGMALAHRLAEAGVPVICVGRRVLTRSEAGDAFPDRECTYVCLPESSIKSLPNALSDLGHKIGSACVFYHCAWGGERSLTDGSFSSQFKNVNASADAVSVAQQMGCRLFVNIGSMEETLAEGHMRKTLHRPSPSNALNYAIAKLAARDACRIVAYLKKIDYIHTRLSVPLHDTLARGGYIPTTIRAVVEAQPYSPPKNPQFYDLISVAEVSRALHTIGLRGRNTADYFIGTGVPRTLKDYFAAAAAIVAGREGLPNTELDSTIEKLFSTAPLAEDTGFRTTYTFERSIRNLVESCGKR